MDTGPENVILVPPSRKRGFLQEDQADGIRVQDHDCDTWIVPTYNEKTMLVNFVAHSEKTGAKFMHASHGTRVGWDSKGVYMHEHHVKRYFGLVRDSASIGMRAAVPEAVPESKVGRGIVKDDCATNRMFHNMLASIPSISADYRGEVLQATFQSVDKDRSGYLSKDEMVSMIRRVLPTMSGKQVVQLMEEVDTRKNGVVKYDEFVAWLNRNAPKDVESAFQKTLRTESDCVRAMFRAWDKNGDGLITQKELTKVIKKTTNLSETQVKTLWLHMDKNKDGRVDYQEFVDFIFCEEYTPQDED